MSTPDDRALHASSFGAAAQEYERSRPSYPDAAVDWLLPPGARDVLDLGAGTGKLTRQLVQRDLSVVAVEPSAGMRAELTRVLPDVRVLEGTAERIPLPDASVDVVLVAQAWHWVDPVPAVPEVARVLAPGGQVGLLWNIRDEREDWVSRLGRIMLRGADQPMNSSNPGVGAPFGAAERLDVPWTHRLSKAAVLDLVASRSYVITLSEEDREDVLAEVRELLDTHPALQGSDVVEIPYVTECSRYVLAPRPGGRPVTAPNPSPRDALAQRVRDALAAHEGVREVRMFGDISFMVDGRMAVAAGRDGALLVCTDPADYDDLLGRGGEPAVMGADLSMGRGWMSVPAARLQADEDLASWVGVGVIGRRPAG